MIWPLHFVEPTPETLVAVLPRMQWADTAAMIDAAEALSERRLDLLVVPDRGFLIVGRDGERYIVRAILGRRIFGPSIVETVEAEAKRIGCTSLALCTGVPAIRRYLERRGYQPREALPEDQIVLVREFYGQQQIQQHDDDANGHDDAEQQRGRDAGSQRAEC